MDDDLYRQKAAAKLEEYQAIIKQYQAKAKGKIVDSRIDVEKQMDDLQKELAAYVGKKLGHGCKLLIQCDEHAKMCFRGEDDAVGAAFSRGMTPRSAIASPAWASISNQMRNLVAGSQIAVISGRA